jgi:hypothetical protein
MGIRFLALRLTLNTVTDDMSADVILIDEAQFFYALVHFVREAVEQRHKSVYVIGIVGRLSAPALWRDSRRGSICRQSHPARRHLRMWGRCASSLAD